MLRDELLIDHNVHALLSCSKPRPRRIPKALMAKNGTGVCLHLCVYVCVFGFWFVSFVRVWAGGWVSF